MGVFLSSTGNQHPPKKRLLQKEGKGREGKGRTGLDRTGQDRKDIYHGSKV